MLPLFCDMTKEEKLIKLFGTTDFHKILSPNVLNGSESIHHWLVSQGVSGETHANRWARTYIPSDLLDNLARLRQLYLREHPQCQQLSPEVLEKILCPEVLNCTLPLSVKLKEIGIKDHPNQWAEKHLPREVYDKIAPYQHSLIVEYRKQVMLERFGHTTSLKDPEVRAKAKATNEAKWGGNPMKSPEVRQRMAETNISRYGFAVANKNPEVRARGVATNLSKYNKVNYSSLSLDEIKQRLGRQGLELLSELDLTLSLMKQTFKVRCSFCGKEFDTHLLSGSSLRFIGNMFKSCECQIHGAKLEWFARDYIREHYYPSAYQWSNIDWLGNREIDIYIPEKHIGFEINGYASHNSDTGYIGKGRPKSPDFHHYKSSACLEHGIKLYHFWYDSDTQESRDRVTAFIDAVLKEERVSIFPGDKIDRDYYPDPSEAGLPYNELPPEPFDSPWGVCYNSGYWQF